MHHTLSSIEPIIIFGLGHTGFSCVRYCQQMGIPICVVDTRLEPPCLSDLKKDYPQVEYFLGDNLAIDLILQKAQQIMVSPGVDVTKQALLQEAQRRGIALIGDIELFARACKKPYVAITGSNGKTTVTTLVGELLKILGLRTGVGGNIGTPVLDLLKDQAQWDVYVLELSSFQLETTYSLRPMVATILNITPDHLDRYASYEDYVRAKQKIVENASHIVPSQELIAQSLAAQTSTGGGFNATSMGAFATQSIDNQDWLVFCEQNNNRQLLCPLSDIPLLGNHNYLNILSALYMVRALAEALNLNWKVKLQEMVQFLTQFKGLDHRCQWVRSHAGVRWVNDSKGTNIGASLAALQSMVQVVKHPAKIILIAGGEGKHQDFGLLKAGLDAIEDSIRQIILIGKDGQLIQEALKTDLAPQEQGSDSNITVVHTLKQAVSLASQLAKQGDMVLLSPSCSSFDQYPNYMARGEDFIQAVNALQ